MSDQEPNYNSIWDLNGNPINKLESDKEPVCVWEQQPHRWVTSCCLVPRGTFMIVDFKYCYNCGRKIQVKE